jgi:signal transduction histidine kinase
LADAIGQAAIPHFRVLIGDERRGKAMVRLRHELFVPVVAMRAAVQIMQTELEDRRVLDRFFTHDYLGDVWSYTELMRRLLGNAEFFGLRSFQPHRTRTLMTADVIAPAVRQIRTLVNDRGFSEHQIRYDKLDLLPALMIDRNHFQQLVFNLLSNAIKYAFKDPQAFHVEIEGRRNGSTIVMRISDWGTGIPRGYEEAIFEEEFRAPGASTIHVAGQGLGLWVARSIVTAHGGTLIVSKRHLPTQFTITLPSSIAGHFKEL